jgi:hypothetical protein
MFLVYDLITLLRIIYIYLGLYIYFFQDLEKLKQEIIPMKKKLDSYHGLPPVSFHFHLSQI